jgi:hypothetical protein
MKLPELIASFSTAAVGPGPCCGGFAFITSLKALLAPLAKTLPRKCLFLALFERQ